MQGRRVKFAIAVSCAALAMCAIATAATAPKAGDWSGSTNTDSDISFTVAKKDGKLRVRDFTLKAFGFSCSGGGGGGETAATAEKAAKVKDGEFQIDSPIVGGAGETIHVEGKFASKNSASGKLRWKLHDDESDCTTGKVRWTAIRD
jgi:hypothetical protein